jgi:hypothetical protein
MILEFGLYNALWFLLAYFIPRENNKLKNEPTQENPSEKNKSLKSLKSLYWIYLLIMSVQLILPLTDLSHNLYLYFYLKILLLSSLGILIDSVLTFFSYFSFFRKTKFIPPWLVLLWVSFSITMQYALFFMSHDLSDLFFLGLLGAFGFPLTYFFADKLKVLRVNNPWPTYFYQGLFWGVFLPLTQLF